MIAASEGKMSSSSERNYQAMYYSAITPLLLSFHPSRSHEPREENTSYKEYHYLNANLNF